MDPTPEISLENRRPPAVTAKRYPRKLFSPWLADTAEELLFVTFLWVSSLGVYTLGTAESSASYPAIRCLLTGTILLLSALFGFLITPSNSRLRLLPFSMLLLAILIPPAILQPVNRAGLAMLDLYLISFVALPVFLRLITAGASLIISAVAAVTAYHCGSGLPGGGDVFAIAIVPVAGIVAAVAAFGNAGRPFKHRAAASSGGWLNAFEEPSAEFSKRFWLAATLFLSLLLVLLFFSLAIADRPIADSAATIYSIVGFLVGCFLLSSLPPKYLKSGAVLLLSSGATIVANLSYHGQIGVTHPAVPVTAALFGSILLPWSIGLQVLVIFLSMVGTVAVVLLQSSQLGFSLSQLGQDLIQFRADIATILVCGTISVLASRIANLRPVNIPAGTLDPTSAGRRDSFGRGRLSGFFQLPLPCQTAISELRSSYLISNILLLVVLSNLVVTLMVFRRSGIPSGVAAASWVLGILAWCGLFAFNQRNREKEPVWFFAGFLTIAQLSLPSILLAWHPEGFDLWFLWLLCIFVGVGLSPWRLAELVPISFAVLTVGLVVAEELQDPPHGELVYAITLLLAIFSSIQSSRRAKISSILSQIEPALAAAEDPVEVVATIADHLAELYEVPYVLFRPDPAELYIELAGAVLPISTARWPLNHLTDRIPQASPATAGGPEYLRGLTPGWDFVDPACGQISIRNALLYRLSPRTKADGGELLPGPSIIVPVMFVLPSIWRRSELVVADALIGLGRLRADSLREFRLREEAASLTERTQAERELELGTLVHDINNTVQDLTVLCDLLIDNPSEGGSADSIGPGAESTVRRIAEIARSMAAVVSDAKRKRELEMLADLSPRETVDVREVLAEILSFARIRGERKRIDVREKFQFNEPVQVRVSAREHLETILRNLLNNALSYSDPGSSVDVSVDYDQKWVRIHVIDNGRGLEPEECDSIFASGYRGQSSRGVTGGLGIGLAQSRRVAESAGGRLIARSAGVNTGSTFTVELPRSTEQPAPAASRSWALVVDDQPALVDFYRRIATALNIPPISAASVSEAKDLLAEQGRPSFVLTDIHLGNSSGLDLVRLIRAQFGPSVPVLVISGLTGEGIEQQARSAGANDFVSKPVGRRALYARIQSLLSLT